MATLSPYLNFNGNTEEAFNFYKSVFGGEFAILSRFKDMPSNPGTPAMSEIDSEKILHIALPISPGHVIMGTDALESFGQVLTFGDNFSISVSVDSEAEADRIFAGLSADGKIEMPLEKTFWGAYFGMCKDKFNVQWMVNYDYK
ncbi:MAG: VOC family protein [Ignavibacteria bacterium]|nr:VOC family protein [Ignavibacteria bacterium]